MRSSSRRNGFSLIELVVVIMILGILAAIAAPRLLGTSTTAIDTGLRQTLSTVRDAVEIYTAANNGDLPGQTDALDTDLIPYLRGDFPVCPVGPAKNASIKYSNSDTAIAGVAAPTEGWHYNKKTGEFICNYKAATASDPAVNYDDY